MPIHASCSFRIDASVYGGLIRYAHMPRKEGNSFAGVRENMVKIAGKAVFLGEQNS